MTNKSVSKWETGGGLPDAALFGNLCAALEITVNELFAGERIEAGRAAAKAEENLADAMEKIRTQDERARRDALHFRAARIVLLSLLGISLLCTVDWGINYLYNLMYEFHDHSFTLAGFLAPLVYPDHGWTLELFWESFRDSLCATTALSVGNIVLECVAAKRG